MHPDPALPICLAPDASADGVRAGISPAMLTDLEKPMVCAWGASWGLGHAADPSQM